MTKWTPPDTLLVIPIKRGAVHCTAPLFVKLCW